MKVCKSGFTLVEVLVATALFVSLMAMSTIAFQRVSSGSHKALQVLELHTKADVILRYMESDLRNMPQTTALHLQTKNNPSTLTFMRPVEDTNPNYFHRGSTENSTNYFAAESPRLTDLIWVRWQWGSGSFKRGQSRINQSSSGIGEGSNNSYNVITGSNLNVMELESNLQSGVQKNAISPTPQRHYDFFEGTGSTLHAVSMDGSTAAGITEKVAVYERVADAHFSGTKCTIVDTEAAPWRTGDYRHLYTTIEVGNDTMVPEAYAVCNIDGKSLNKDRLNVLGCDATDSDGNKIYPGQVRYLFSGVEYFKLDLIGRDGKVIDSGNESDRLNDGSDSIDISGINPVQGHGYEARPTHVRISYLLHAVDLKEKDELDFDEDDDDTEALATAIRDAVEAEAWPTRIEKIHSYKRHALKHGFASVLITQSVQLGY